MTDDTKLREIRERLNAIAPYPAWGADEEVTALSLARYLLVQAQVTWAGHVLPFTGAAGESLDPAKLARMSAEFAAGFALKALYRADPAEADLAAKQIQDAWNDGGEVGGWLWDLLGEETAEAVTKLAGELSAVEAAREASRA